MYYPYAFFSKKNSLAEYNYEIYDKEILVILRNLNRNVIYAALVRISS